MDTAETRGYLFSDSALDVERWTFDFLRKQT
jgi:hypothetical protein